MRETGDTGGVTPPLPAKKNYHGYNENQAAQRVKYTTVGKTNKILYMEGGIRT